MSHNPRIKFNSEGEITISGTVVVTGIDNIVESVKAETISSSNTVLNLASDSLLNQSSDGTLIKIDSETELNSTNHFVLVNAATNSVNINLPSASLLSGQEYTIKKIDASSNVINITSKPVETYRECDILGPETKLGYEGSYFGSSVAVNSSGDRLVAGAYLGGDKNQGIASVYSRNISKWKEEAVLTGTFAVNASDYFGFSVAINSAGNRVVVGAYQDERSTTLSVGLAYVFDSGSTGWTQTAVLSGTLAINASDNFGISVSTNQVGDRIIVGASRDEAPGNGNGSGVVYVFDSGSTGWVQKAILSGSLATGSNDYFGYSTCMNGSGNAAVIGAYADEALNSSSSSGIVYVYFSGSSGWYQQAALSGTYATDLDDYFGYSVNINSVGDRIIVGAIGDEIDTTASIGLAYIFDSGSGGWLQSSVLSASTSANDEFGNAVTISSNGNIVVIGASSDEKAGAGNNSGLAFIFKSGSSGWTQNSILSGTLAVDTLDKFGVSVTTNAAGDFVFIGASQDERNSTRTGENVALFNTGLMYVFSAGEIDNGYSNIYLKNKGDSITLISDGTSSWSTF